MLLDIAYRDSQVRPLVSCSLRPFSILALAYWDINDIRMLSPLCFERDD